MIKSVSKNSDAKGLTPREIVAALYEDMVRFAPPQDDTSLVVIKKVK